MRKKIIYGFLILLGILLVVLAYFTRFDIPVEKLKEKYANAQSKFMELDGMQVHYRVEGKGTPIVLLHGTGASLHTWDAWTKELQKEFQVIRLDLPAYGLTGPNKDNNYQVSIYIRFLNAFLTKLNCKEFHIAGNSLGGHIAWEYALAYPQEVKKMILIDPGGYPINKKLPWVFRVAQTPVLNGIVRYVTPEFFFRNNLEQVYEDDSKITDELVTRYYELSLRTGNRSAFIERVSQKPETNYKKLNQIKTPTLIQWGKEDTWIPPSSIEKYKAVMPNVETILYEKAGHVPMEEIPELTVKDAIRFLKK